MELQPSHSPVEPAVKPAALSAKAAESSGVFQFFLDEMLAQPDQDATIFPLLSEPSADGIYQRTQVIHHHSASKVTDHHSVANPQSSEQLSNQDVASPSAADQTAAYDQLLQTQQQLTQLLAPPYLPMPMVIQQSLQNFVDAYLKSRHMQGFVQSLEHFKTPDGKDALRMVLWPETLGRVEVFMKADGRQINLIFNGSPEFRQYITEQIGDLSQALAASGFSLGSHEFSQGRHQQDDSSASTNEPSEAYASEDISIFGEISKSALNIGQDLNQYLQKPSQLVQTI